MVERESDQQPAEFTPIRDSKIISIPSEKIVEKLGLVNSPQYLSNSIKGSLWGNIDNNRILLECRSLTVMQQPRSGSVNIYDFDDCLMSASRWHQEEYRRLEQSEILHKQDINITAQRAKDIYDLSKVLVSRVVEKEPRYTPRLNLVLLSIYGNLLRDGSQKEQAEEQVWQELLVWRETIGQQMQISGDKALNAYAINPVIQRIFMSNSPANFLYTEFVRDILGKTGQKDIRVITTRGKIEGPLGQVYKTHVSGLMRQKSIFGQGIDLVVYSNDVKAEALLSTMKLLPGIEERLIRVYDDNPSEIIPYLQAARNLGVHNIEIVQVSHPDAKRKNTHIEAEPTLSYKIGETRLNHFSPIHDASKL